jgi:hypothetical protein
VIRGVLLFLPRVVCVVACLTIITLASPVLFWLGDE